MTLTIGLPPAFAAIMAGWPTPAGEFEAAGLVVIISALLIHKPQQWEISP